MIIFALRLPRLGKRELAWCFSYARSFCACLVLSVSSSSLSLGRAAVCDCGTSWTFLFLYVAFVLSFFVLHSFFFWRLGKVMLHNFLCIFTYMFVCKDSIYRLYFQSELEIKETTETEASSTYLDCYLYIDNRKLTTRLYDKRDDFNFPIGNFPGCS